jgi:hypothetical protein
MKMTVMTQMFEIKHIYTKKCKIHVINLHFIHFSNISIDNIF